MKKIVLAVVGVATLAALANPAAAADLPRRYEPPRAPIYVPPLAYNWTGFYLGINGGGAFGHSNWDSAGSFSLTGGLVGGTVGYNWQWGSPIVLGVEGDLDWTNIAATTTNIPCPLAGCRTANNWLSTVRGRIGYAANQIMPYITGGLAFGDIKASIPVPGFTQATATNAGWTVGAGLEVAIAGPWTAKVEYLYADLGKTNCGIACSGFVTDNVSFRTNILRAGLNYRF
jgi:outer membrane immunogenic protein